MSGGPADTPWWLGGWWDENKGEKKEHDAAAHGDKSNDEKENQRPVVAWAGKNNIGGPTAKPSSSHPVFSVPQAEEEDLSERPMSAINPFPEFYKEQIIPRGTGADDPPQPRQMTAGQRLAGWEAYNSEMKDVQRRTEEIIKAKKEKEDKNAEELALQEAIRTRTPKTVQVDSDDAPDMVGWNDVMELRNEARQAEGHGHGHSHGHAHSHAHAHSQHTHGHSHGHSHAHGHCQGHSHSQEAREESESEFDDETLMSFPFDMVLASNPELAEGFNQASDELQMEIRELWAVRNSDALRKLCEVDKEDDESLPDTAADSQIPDQFDIAEDPPVAPPGADSPEVLDLDSSSEREDSEKPDREAATKKKKKVLKTRGDRIESAENSENSEEEAPLKVAHVKPGNKMRTPGAGYFRKSAVVAVQGTDKELRDACAKWKTNCYTGEARELLGSVGVVTATHPSGCVSVIFKGERKLKLPPNAMKLFCGPVRGPVMSSDLELKMASDVIDAIKSEDGMWTTKEFLEPEEAKLACRDAVNLCEEEDKMIMGGTGQGEARKRDGTMRGDFIRWMPKQKSYDGYDNTVPEGIDLLLCRLHRLRKALAYLLEKPLYRTSIQLARYPGDMKGYIRHRDVKLGLKEPERRRITVTYYCNEGWKEEHGGEFVLYPKTRNPHLVARNSDPPAEKDRKNNESFSVAKKFLPTANSLAIFQSHTFHEVLPMNRPRVAFAFWMYGPQSLGLKYPGSEGDQVDEDTREEVKV